jgi:NADH-quinone oxidoreductase subunit C
MNESKYISILQGQFGGQTVKFAGDTALVIERAQIVDVADALRKLGFERLSDITAVDYFPEEEPRFHLVYQFTSVSNAAILEVRVPVPGVNPSVATIETVYPNANWRERELFDMFGITFDGHSDLRRILMPHDWQGYPLRKDYPLGYEEPQYSFNFEEISLRKPFAKRGQA